jgi:hypothetical protein
VQAEVAHIWSVSETDTLMRISKQHCEMKQKGQWGLFAFNYCPSLTGKAVYEQWYSSKRNSRERGDVDVWETGPNAVETVMHGPPANDIVVDSLSAVDVVVDGPKAVDIVVDVSRASAPDLRASPVDTLVDDPIMNATPGSAVDVNAVSKASVFVSQVASRELLAILTQKKIASFRKSIPNGYATWSKVKRKAWDNVGRDPNGFFYKYTCPGVQAEVAHIWSESETDTLMRISKQHCEMKQKGQWGLFAFNYCPSLTGKAVYEQWYSSKQNNHKRGDDDDWERAALQSLDVVEKQMQIEANDKEFIVGESSIYVFCWTRCSIGSNWRVSYFVFRFSKPWISY